MINQVGCLAGYAGHLQPSENTCPLPESRGKYFLDQHFCNVLNVLNANLVGVWSFYILRGFVHL